LKELDLEETMKEINALNQTMLNPDPLNQAASASLADPLPMQPTQEKPENVPKDASES